MIEQDEKYYRDRISRAEIELWGVERIYNKNKSYRDTLNHNSKEYQKWDNWVKSGERSIESLKREIEGNERALVELQNKPPAPIVEDAKTETPGVVVISLNPKKKDQ